MHKCELKPLPSNCWLENLESLPLKLHAQNRLCLIQNIKLRMYFQIKRMYVLTHYSILVWRVWRGRLITKLYIKSNLSITSSYAWEEMGMFQCLCNNENQKSKGNSPSSYEVCRPFNNVLPLGNKTSDAYIICDNPCIKVRKKPDAFKF